MSKGLLWALIGESSQYRRFKVMNINNVRRIARHLIQFPPPERTKILTSIPGRDRIKVIEEFKRIMDDSPKDR